MSERVKVAVVGTGYLGDHHVRILSGLPSAELVGFVELDDVRAEEIAGKYGARRLAGLAEVAQTCRAAVVATPTVAHAEVGAALLRAGVDVLVEKPVTVTEAEAELLVRLARENRRVMAVGHVERHNPAVDAVLKLQPQARFVEAERIGVWVGRSLDVDVILDLMVHDLDVLLALIPEPVTEVRAVGVPVLTDQVDIANVRIAFAGGAVANLTASRVSVEPVRKIRIFQRDAYYSIDTRSREVSGARLVRGEGVPKIEKIPIEVAAVDPLTAELEDFLGAVRERRDPKVTGEAGLEALRLARRILDAMTR